MHLTEEGADGNEIVPHWDKNLKLLFKESQTHHKRQIIQTCLGFKALRCQTAPSSASTCEKSTTEVERHWLR